MGIWRTPGSGRAGRTVKSIHHSVIPSWIDGNQHPGMESEKLADKNTNYLNTRTEFKGTDQGIGKERVLVRIGTDCQ
jgi:hypothetical protein